MLREINHQDILSFLVPNILSSHFWGEGHRNTVHSRAKFLPFEIFIFIFFGEKDTQGKLGLVVGLEERLFLVGRMFSIFAKHSGRAEMTSTYSRSLVLEAGG